jgi:hypothetical protein
LAADSMVTTAWPIRLSYSRVSRSRKVAIDYRPVHTYTMSNDIAYIEPKARVY